MQKEFEHVRQFVSTLGKNPDDKDANLEVGKYYALLKETGWIDDKGRYRTPPGLKYDPKTVGDEESKRTRLDDAINTKSLLVMLAAQFGDPYAPGEQPEWVAEPRLQRAEHVPAAPRECSARGPRDAASRRQRERATRCVAFETAAVGHLAVRQTQPARVVRRERLLERLAHHV